MISLCCLLIFVICSSRQGLNDEDRSKPFGTKLIELLCAENTPDIVLISSSLMLEPAVCCDDEMFGRKTRFDPEYYLTRINHYKHARYLERLISDKVGCQVSIDNLGLSGAVMSDHYFQ